jgi:hypothetical protein
MCSTSQDMSPRGPEMKLSSDMAAENMSFAMTYLRAIV